MINAIDVTSPQWGNMCSPRRHFGGTPLPSAPPMPHKGFGVGGEHGERHYATFSIGGFFISSSLCRSR